MKARTKIRMRMRMRMRRRIRMKEVTRQTDRLTDRRSLIDWTEESGLSILCGSPQTGGGEEKARKIGTSHGPTASTPDGSLDMELNCSN
jgi:hypothetical protein